MLSLLPPFITTAVRGLEQQLDRVRATFVVSGHHFIALETRRLSLTSLCCPQGNVSPSLNIYGHIRIKCYSDLCTFSALGGVAYLYLPRVMVCLNCSLLPPGDKAVK